MRLGLLAPPPRPTTIPPPFVPNGRHGRRHGYVPGGVDMSARGPQEVPAEESAIFVCNLTKCDRFVRREEET